jgi:hypothetical protein
LQSRNHVCESVHYRCVYTSSIGDDKPQPMNTSWQHILLGRKLIQATWQIQQRANWHLNHDLSRSLGKPTLWYFISFVAQWQKECYFAFVHLKEVAWDSEILESSRSLGSNWHQLVFSFRIDELGTII